MADDASAALPAGRFSDWLLQIRDAPRRQDGATVPCGTCTGCCTSSQFIHIGPEEVETISRIPPDLLFPAPGLPKGNVVLGYDENGHCPMFEGGRCSIYGHRPRTCRTYDCRVLPAAGLELDDDDKLEITERTRRWRFDFPARVDQDLHAAVRAAAAFLRVNASLLPEGAVPRQPTQLAFLAVQVHDAFLEGGEVVAPPLDEVEAAIRRASSRRGDNES